jgi:hypothetical protein
MAFIFISFAHTSIAQSINTKALHFVQGFGDVGDTGLLA